MKPFDVLLDVHSNLLIFGQSRGDKLYCLRARFKDGCFSPIYPPKYLKIAREKIWGKLKLLNDDVKGQIDQRLWFIARDTIAWRAEKDIEQANCYICPPDED